MNIEEAMKVAEAFFSNYSAENDGFNDGDDPDEFKMYFQHVEPDDEGGMEIAFSVGPNYDEEDPEMVELAMKHIQALRAAHPELDKFRIEPWLFNSV